MAILKCRPALHIPIVLRVKPESLTVAPGMLPCGLCVSLSVICHHPSPLGSGPSESLVSHASVFCSGEKLI